MQTITTTLNEFMCADQWQTRLLKDLDERWFQDIGEQHSAALGRFGRLIDYVKQVNDGLTVTIHFIRHRLPETRSLTVSALDDRATLLGIMDEVARELDLLQLETMDHGDDHAHVVDIEEHLRPTIWSEMRTEAKGLTRIGRPGTTLAEIFG